MQTTSFLLLTSSATESISVKVVHLYRGLLCQLYSFQIASISKLAFHNVFCWYFWQSTGTEQNNRSASMIWRSMC